MANNIWSNYTEKTATPVDADEVMVRDSTDGKNKRLLFGAFWKWVAKKLNEATISELQTSNKTIIGAINALNSDRVRVNFETDKSGNANVIFPNGFFRSNASVSITIFDGNIYTQIFPNAIYTNQVNIVSAYANSSGWVDFIKVNMIFK